jgi:succinate dehydrogenase/fumarate reductase flavoprotein subunit
LHVDSSLTNVHSIKTFSSSTSYYLSTNTTPDVLVVGSGAAALTAALRAKSLGLSPLVVEKSSHIGGTTSYSGGGLWVPNSGLHPNNNDSFDDALKYMEAIIGDNDGPASTRERKVAFLEEGPKMVQFLAKEGFEWLPSTGYPDYFPLSPGGKVSGRSIEGNLFNLNRLGEWKEKMRMGVRVPSLPLYTYEGAKLFQWKSSWIGLITAMKVVYWRKKRHMWMGKDPVTKGESLIGQLLRMNVEKDIPIWLDAPLTQLIERNGAVTGAIVEKDGKEVHVHPKRGIILAAGGFSRSNSMREEHHGRPFTAAWSLCAPTDTGEVINAAVSVGAATSLMDDAWWGPTVLDPTSGKVTWMQFERCLPHSMIVDKDGKRFTNEAQSYTALIKDQFRRSRTTCAIPAYFILDSRHRRRYVLAGLMPGKVPQAALDSGMVVEANSLKELAQKLSINPAGLEATASRFNGMVATGVDEDFGRGGSPYDTWFGDPKYKPNPTLGTIERAPFYGARIVPSDLGTKGGVLTDEYARALRDDGSVIRGLYAVGNTSATVMGRHYIGAGSTLGPALAFAFIAANHVASA